MTILVDENIIRFDVTMNDRLVWGIQVIRSTIASIMEINVSDTRPKRGHFVGEQGAWAWRYSKASTSSAAYIRTLHKVNIQMLQDTEINTHRGDIESPHGTQHGVQISPIRILHYLRHRRGGSRQCFSKYPSRRLEGSPLNFTHQEEIIL